jgi:hypothetical protein
LELAALQRAPADDWARWHVFLRRWYKSLVYTSGWRRLQEVLILALNLQKFTLTSYTVSGPALGSFPLCHHFGCLQRTTAAFLSANLPRQLCKFRRGPQSGPTLAGDTGVLGKYEGTGDDWMMDLSNDKRQATWWPPCVSQGLSSVIMAGSTFVGRGEMWVPLRRLSKPTGLPLPIVARCATFHQQACAMGSWAAAEPALIDGESVFHDFSRGRSDTFQKAADIR